MNSRFLNPVILLCLLGIGCKSPELSNNCDPNGKSIQDRFLSQQVLSNSSPENKLLLKSAFPDNIFECEKDAVSAVASGSPSNSSAQTETSGSAGTTGGSTTTTSGSTTSTSGDSTATASNASVASVAITSLTYSTSIGYFTQNTAITDIIPTIVGGTPTSCTSSPSLPTGLSLNQTNCRISGTPTVGSALTTYTITASNTSGSVTGTTNFQVNLVPKFVYFGHFTSNDISRFSINQSTGALTNLGANSLLGGARKGRDLTTDPSGKYLFSATFDGGDVGSQVIQADGSLSTRALNVQINNPESITVDPTGKFVYSVGTSGSFVASYTVNQTTGVLSFVNSVSTGLTSRWIRVHPNGKFSYVMDGTTGFETIRVYSINQTTGSLTASSTNTLSAPGTQEQVVIHPNGNFLFSSDRTLAKFRRFNLDSSTGVLSGEVVFSALPFGPEHLVVSPSGKYLYVAGQSATTVRLYSIDQSTGGLTFNADFTATNNVSDMVIDPSENFLIVSNYGSSTYQVLRVDSTNGTLSSVASGSTGGSNPNTIAVTGNNN